MHEVAHSRSAGGDRPPQQTLEGLEEPMTVVATEAAGSPRGAQRGSEQGLVSVDVTHPSQELLIQQHGLDGGAAGAQAGGKVGFADAERIRAEALEARTRLGLPEPEDPAELARIAQEQHRTATREAEGEVNVPIGGGAVTSERLGGHQLTRHAEVDAEYSSVVQPEQKVLAQALDRVDPAAEELGAQAGRPGQEHGPGAGGVDPHDGSSEHQRGDPAPGDLDFG
jgi:hypothetical protein